MRWIWILALIVTACANHPIRKTTLLEEALVPPPTQLPVPMSRQYAPMPMGPAPGLRFITLEWNNSPFNVSFGFTTGLQATTNLTDWTEVVSFPCQLTNTITLTNRPPAEFYRAFTR